MKFKTAIYAIVGVVIVHVISLIVSVYSFFPNFDIIMHFAGGFVMGMLGLAIHHAVTNRAHTHSIPYWYHYLFVVSFVMLIAVAWEFHEYILDNTLVLWYGWQKTQLSLRDTMFDLLMGFIGGSVAFFSFKKSL